MPDATGTLLARPRASPQAVTAGALPEIARPVRRRVAGATVRVAGAGASS